MGSATGGHVSEGFVFRYEVYFEDECFACGALTERWVVGEATAYPLCGSCYAQAEAEQAARPEIKHQD